jgi:hypothetical protein
LVRRLCLRFTIYRKVIGIRKSLMDLIQRTKLVNTNITGDKKNNSSKRNKDNAKPKNDNKCHRCGDFSHFAKNCRTPKRLVALYQEFLKEVKPVGDKRCEAHFNIASEAVPREGCSKPVSKEKENNNSLNIEENLPSTDNMLQDFGFEDMFEDLK